MREVASIEVRGAHVHNLKQLSLNIPKHKISLITGPSGAGKSSLLIGTLFAESKRRARELIQLSQGAALNSVTERSCVDAIRNLPPVYALEPGVYVSSKATLANYLGLEKLFFEMTSKLGHRRCTRCEGTIRNWHLAEILSDLKSAFADEIILICVLVAGPKKSNQTISALLAPYLKQGFTRFFYNNREYDADEVEFEELGALPFQPTSHLGVMIDRLNVFDTNLIFALDEALRQETVGLFVKPYHAANDQKVFYYSRAGICKLCGYTTFALSPNHFRLSLGVPLSRFSGITSELTTLSEFTPLEQAEFENVSFDSFTLGELLQLEFVELKSKIESGSLKLSLLTELVSAFVNFGLGHLSLLRAVATLSRGELQRVRILRALLGAGRIGCYIFDEPSEGLHWANLESLQTAFVKLCASGSTVLIADEKDFFKKRADTLFVLGPGSAEAGGKLQFAGKPEEYLTSAGSISETKLRASELSQWIRLYGASAFNLKTIDVSFPRYALSAVTGISGSGKTNLVLRTLVPVLKALRKGKLLSEQLKEFSLSGCEVDGSLLGLKSTYVVRKPESLQGFVAGYIGLFDLVKQLFVNTLTSKLHGYSIAAFSIPARGSAFSLVCPECRGVGLINASTEAEPCSACFGDRFKKEAWELKYKGIPLPEFLKLTIGVASQYLKINKAAASLLEYVGNFGLDYLVLGQRLNELSNGEFQRLCLVKTCIGQVKDYLFVFDEPCSGLPRAEVMVLVANFRKLIEAGGTVVVVDHNMDFIRACDWIVDLGPGAGRFGGEVVISGSIEKVMASKESKTAEVLRGFE